LLFYLHLNGILFKKMDVFLNEATLGDVRAAIGGWCAAMRRTRGANQAELAENLGLSRATVSCLERGGNFTIDTLLKVLRHFGEMDAFHGFVMDRAEASETLNLY